MVHTLPKIVATGKKRLGQGHGSGRVKTSGRGQKGQNARNKRPIYFEGGALPLTKRLPFLRGKDRNKVITAKPAVLNLSDLAKIPAGKEVNIDNLINYRIVKASAKQTGVKLLGNGTVEKAYIVTIPASKSAVEKIAQAGGSVKVK